MSDLIDRQAAIDALLHNQEVYSNNFGTDAIDKYTIAIIDNDVQTIAQLPSAEPQRKKGRWIYRPENEWGETWVCSECEMGKPRYNYCPNCGADMRTSE